MKTPLRVLIAEDSPPDAELVLRQLRRAGFEPEWERVDNEEDYLARLRPELDIILSDFEMPQFGGPRALELLRASSLDTPFILISGTIGEDAAVAAMKLGATDYLLKDRLERLGSAVDNALEQSSLRRQQRQAERVVRESAAFTDDVLNSLTAEVVVLDENGVITATNEAWRQFARENGGGDLLGENYLATCAKCALRLGGAEAAAAEQGIRAVLGGEATDFTMEYPCHSRTEQRWFQMRVSPLRGTQRGVVVAHEKITERKRAEEALRLFRKLVDQSNDTFEVVDPATGRFLDVNEKGCAELGYSRAEHLALRVFDIDPLVSEADWPQVAETIRAAGVLSREGLHRRKDGSTYPVELNAKWVRLDRDYIVAVVRDITQRQGVEKRVREQAAMLDQAHDAILMRGFHDRKIRFWNKGAETLYGWTAAEAIGRDVGELICIDPNVPDEIRDRLLIDDEWRGETRHKTRDGRKLIVNTRGTLVRDAAGEPESVLSINTDVTEQKELESRYLRAQRMDSIGTLASGVAHDLNNILAPIMMSVPILRRDLTAVQREGIITTIEMSAARGAEIVRQVLTFGRGLEGERLPLHIDALVKEMMKIMRGTFPKDIATRSSLAPDLWPVLGDATQIHQVLLNLCVNARDAMPGGGQVLIAAHNLDLDASYASMIPEAGTGPHVLLEITDSGSGMPPEIVERIFDPFFTTKATGQGTGLGLSTCLGIVKSHGGFIQVNTQPGKGTAFQVYLPAAPDHAAAPRQMAPAKPPEGRGETVLVVDDEPSLSGVARMVLETAGYRVLLAADGTEALAVFAMNSGTVAVVLTDLMMPFMDGVALTRALRMLSPKLPIIASTGMGEKTKLAELKAMNIATILHKPYAADLLLRTIDAALHPPASPPIV